MRPKRARKSAKYIILNSDSGILSLFCISKFKCRLILGRNNRKSINKGSNEVNLRLNRIKTCQKGYNKDLNSDSGL